MHSILKVLLLLTILIIPLLIPVRSLGYEQIKVVFLVIMLSLSGIIWLYLLSKNEFKFPKTKVSILGLIFIGSLFLGSIFGLDFLRSLLGRPPYLQGLILYCYIFFFYLLISSSKLNLKEVSQALCISAFFVSLSAIIQWAEIEFFHKNIPTYAGRVVSTFGQPNLYSSFLLFSMPFSLSLFLQKTKQNLLVLLSLTASIFAIFLSQSRAAILLTFLLLIAWLFLKAKSKLDKKYWPIAIICVLLSIFALGLLSKNLIYQEIITPLNSSWLIENSPEKRIFLWPVFFELIKNHLLFGYGLDNIPPAFSDYFKNLDFNSLNNPVYHSLKNINVDRTHNLFLDLLMFAGVGALISWLALFIKSFQKSNNFTLKSALILYLIWVQLQPQGIVQLLYFWLLLGLIDKQT